MWGGEGKEIALVGVGATMVFCLLQRFNTL